MKTLFLAQHNYLFILQFIDDNQCVILKGQTGSGKSAFLPLLLYLNALDRKRKMNKKLGDKSEPHVRIIFFEPTRVAVVALYRYVSKLVFLLSRTEGAQSDFKNCEVGFVIGNTDSDNPERKLNKNTNIVFATCGKCVRCENNESSLLVIGMGRQWTNLNPKYGSLWNETFVHAADVIVQDEVHELQIENQILFYHVISELLRRHGRLQEQNDNVRFIAMSATLNCNKMQNYLLALVHERDNENIYHLFLISL